MAEKDQLTQQEINQPVTLGLAYLIAVHMQMM